MAGFLPRSPPVASAGERLNIPVVIIAKAKGP
jgi:hypothetical protein